MQAKFHEKKVPFPTKHGQQKVTDFVHASTSLFLRFLFDILPSQVIGRLFFLSRHKAHLNA
jgi:hypothetical protein